MQQRNIVYEVLFCICLIGICFASPVPVSNFWNNPWLGEILEKFPNINDRLGNILQRNLVSQKMNVCLIVNNHITWYPLNFSIDIYI